MRYFEVILCPIFSMFIVACDTAPTVKQDVPWNSDVVDTNCIRRAIENTPGIKFEKQEVRESTGICAVGECIMKFFTISYTVESNKKYKQASVQFKQTNKGHLKVENLATGTIFEGFSKEDRIGFEKVQQELGKSISKACPESTTSIREQSPVISKVQTEQ